MQEVRRPDPNGSAHPVNYTPGVSVPGAYVYFIAGLGACSDASAQVNVTESPAPDAGIDDIITICSDDVPFSMLSQLGGTPDTGGAWTDSGGNPVSQTFDPGSDLAGTYTYTVAGVAPCFDAFSTLTVNVNTATDAGVDGTIDVCTNDPTFQLFAVLGGAPQVSGNWTDPNGNPFSGTFIPGSSIGGDYNYTVTGVSPCVDDFSTVTVNQTVAPNAGTNSSLVICSDQVPFNLYDELGGVPDVTGVWTDPDGNAFFDPLDPAIANSGVYTYLVAGQGPCADASATVSLSINQAPDAGTGGSFDFCSNDQIIDLFTLLTGSPDGTGNWIAPGGGAVGGSFDPSSDPVGDYTYTVAGLSPCADAVATISVSVTAAPEAGQNSSITVCSDGPIVPLYNVLGGTPDVGGTWYRPNGASFNGNYNPVNSAGGVYTYVVAGTGPCENDTSTVLVTRNIAPDAGTNGTITVCSTSGQFALLPALGGGPDNTGSWIDPNGVAVPTGNFTPGLSVPGVYLYVVDGSAPCVNDSSTVEVIVNTAADAGASVNIIICGNDAPFSLYDELDGTPDIGGTWVGPTGMHSVIYDPIFDGTGAYTYTVAGLAPCSDATATVFVQEVSPVDAGTNAAISVCESDAPVILFDELGGTPNGGGNWTNPGGGGFNGIFDPMVGAAGDYDYTVIGTPPCSDSVATVTITLLPTPLSGLPGTITTCADVAQIDLFNALSGTYDPGGIWNDDFGTGQLSGSILSPTGLTPGDYEFTYTVNGNGSCSDQSTTITVTIVSALDAGQNSSISVCGNEVNFLLFNGLNGNPQSGGGWNDDDNTNALVNGTLNATVLTAGSYDFTYILTGSSGCASDSAQLSVTIVDEPNAGFDDTYQVCSSVTSFNLTNELGGNPAPNGVWVDQLLNPHSNTYNPPIDSSGTFTYTVAGTGPCLDAVSTLVVTEIVAADAGDNNIISVCSSDGAFTLLDSLLGNPDLAGSSADPNLNPHSGSFFPGSDISGPYIYTVNGTVPCPDDDAVLNVQVNSPPNAGSPTSVTLCSNDGPVLLLSYLSGADATGIWIDDNGTVFSGFFIPGTTPPGVFTYTVDGVDPCSPSSSTVSVFVNDEPDPGLPSSVTVCANSGTINLFQLLGGTPQNNGSWTGPNGVHSGLFQSASDPAGSYVYTVQGVAPCVASSSTVAVAVDPQPSAGNNVLAVICSDTIAFSLFDLITGNPDIVGTWEDPNSDPFSGIFIPNISVSGTYTYTVNGVGLCANDISTVTIVVNQQANAGNGTIIDVCETDGSVNLFNALTGSPSSGGVWTDPNGSSHSGSFIPGTSVPGDYSYTVSAISPCSNDVAVVTVNVDAASDAGLSAVHTTCNDANPFTLISFLGGSPDLNGNWLNPLNAISTGIYLPGNSDPGVYTYTVPGIGVCPDDISSLTIVENNAPNAGDNTTAILCSTVGTFSMVDELDGSPDAGGDWYDPNGSPTNGLFVSGISMNGVYSYIIDATSPCITDTALLDLTVTIAPDAGINAAVVVCENEASLVLTDLLLGTPDSIGNWFGPDSSLHSPFFDPAIDPSGTYTYYVSGSFPCLDITSTVQMTVVDAPNAGTDASLTTCVSDPGFNLATGLIGADAGGNWEDPATTGALTGSVVDATSLTPAIYDFYYIVQGTSPCEDDTAIIQLEVTSALYAGVDSFVIVCQNEPIIQLFDLLGAGAQPGGTWVDSDNSGDPLVVLGQFNPSSIVTPNSLWCFTYLLTGASSCLSDSAVVCVQVLEGPDAGSDGVISICETTSPFSLYSVIAGEAAGGQWYNSGGISVVDSIFPATAVSDTFIYVVPGVGGCPADSSQAIVLVSSSPNSGTPFTSINVCSSDFPFNMIDSVGGNPDPNGGWAVQGCAVPVGGVFNPAVSAPGQYCYIVPGTGACPPSQSILDITVSIAPDAGGDGQVTVCSIDPNVLLFFELTGSPDLGGQWLAPDSTAHSGVLNPNMDASGTYAYITVASGGCENDTAYVDVQIFQGPNAGISAVVDTCALIPSLNLFDVLGGNPDTTGIWIPQNGGTVIGDTLYVTGLPVGVYDFVYLVTGSGPCLDSAATVSVDFTSGGANAGLDGDLILCSTTDSLDLNSILIGSHDVGGSWDVTVGNPGFLQDSVLCVSCLPTDSLFTFFYVVVEPGCGADTSFYNIETVHGPDVGGSTTVNVCFNDSTFNIFDQLSGTPDTTGFWIGPLGNAVSPVFDPGVSKEGPYYYIIAPLPPCPVDTATVFVEEWDTPDAGFDASLFGCTGNFSLDLFNWLGTTDTSGIWLDLDNTGNLTGSSFSFDTIAAGIYDVQYVVSNPGCGNDTSDVEIKVLQPIEIDNFVFECDMENWTYSASFDILFGDSLSYAITGDFGDLIPGSPFTYYTETYLLYEPLVVNITDNFGCGALDIDTISSCDFGELVFVPESFSPNNDGINDFFEILGIEGFPNNVIHIYNRWGDLIYDQAGYDNRAIRWDGSSVNALIGSEAPAGTYYYVLDLGVNGADALTGFVYLNK